MSKNTLGPHGIDLSAPGGIQALLDFHRQTFGNARMEDDPAATAAAEAAKAAADAAAAASAAEGDKGFPAATPVADMTVEQQVAYYKHQSRVNEDRWKNTQVDPREVQRLKEAAAELAALKLSQMEPAEKALEEARLKGREEALAETTPKVAARLVTAEFRAALAGRRTTEQVQALVEPLDLTKFLTPDGEVDADKVKTYVDGIVPGGKRWPDTGQGNRGDSKGATGVNAGKSLFEERHKK